MTGRYHRELKLEYELWSPPMIDIDQSDGTLLYQDPANRTNQFQIPIEHNDKLEDIIREYLRCYLSVNIWHDNEIIIGLVVNNLKQFEDTDNRIPRFRDKLIDYEIAREKDASCYNRYAWRLKRLSAGYYGWRCQSDYKKFH